MPTLFSIHCEACAFARKSDDQRTYLRVEDGGRVALPHPGEHARAHELTGKGLAELQREGRLEIFDVYLCARCGELAEFPRARIEDDPEAVERLAGEREEAPCSRCGGAEGWLDLFSVDGEVCPRCGEGELVATWDIE